MAFVCKQCGECCKTYWITITPAELTAMASQLKLSEEEFVENYCQLLLQFFPSPQMQSSLVVPIQKVPTEFLKKLHDKLTVLPDGFIALPSLAFRRNKETCVMHDTLSGKCSVYKNKPEQCNLFPFISLSEKPDFAKNYSFCPALKENPKPPAGWDKAVAAHYAKFSKYFESVGKDGFKKTWRNWPKKGTLLVKNDFVCSLREKDFFEIIQDFK